MRGDSTRYGTLVVCDTCGARFMSSTRDGAWQALAEHAHRGGCQPPRLDHRRQRSRT